MSKISDKEIAEIRQLDSGMSITQKRLELIQNLADSYEAQQQALQSAQEEISKLQQERDCYKLWLERNQADYLKSATANAAMLQVLKWYGDQENHDSGYARYNDDGEVAGFESYIEEDYGERARKIIADIEKGAEGHE